VEHHYGAIGGKSPILEYTSAQARALEAELRRGGMDARVAIAMRYWKPFTEEAIEALRGFDPEEVVLLPLYPQYSRTTTGSAYKEWQRRASEKHWQPRTHVVEHFFEDAAYIGAVTALVDRALSQFARPDEVEMIFSAHSVPMEVIEKGDPYRDHIERTVELVWRRGGWRCGRHLCYQSKVGPSKWLRPMMRETLEDLARRGSKHVLMVPISFVSDHVETLFEIDIEHREIAEKAGIEEFRMVPGLNDDPAFIAALAGLVRRAASQPEAAQTQGVGDH
jgi:ferrochelatase